MSTVPGGEPRPVTVQEVAVSFEEVKDLSIQVDSLATQVTDLEEQKNEKIRAMLIRVRSGGLPEDAKILAAALFRVGTTSSAEQMALDVDRLTEIDEEVKANQGQAAIWFSSEEVMTVHRFGGADDYEKRSYLHLGILAEDASLQVGLVGQLSIPLLKEVRVSLGKPVNYKSQSLLERIWLNTHKTIWSDPEAPAPKIDITNPHEETLIIGNEMVEQAIGDASKNTREGLKTLKDQLTRTLF